MDLGDVQSLLTDEELVGGRDSTLFQEFFPAFIRVDEAERFALVLDGKGGGDGLNLVLGNPPLLVPLTTLSTSIASTAPSCPHL